MTTIPSVALDHVHVGEVEAAQLEEAGRQLEEAGDAVERARRQRLGCAVSGGLAVEEAV